ncbi:MAG: hypothetical protein JO161_00115 [Planctomycetaceae bacterium]|nr:hypothetical protein [Planctomycetaceae bacterium]
MVKKLVKMITVLALLLGCYLGYVRAFSMVVTRLSAARKLENIAFTAQDSKSKKEAALRAREVFGPDHWAAQDDLSERYYNSERGFWMYSQKDERIIEQDGVRYDGKRIILTPIAIIWGSRDGKSTKTVTADEGIVDFNQPFMLNMKPDAEPLVVKYAQLIGNVMIRDDHGTSRDQTDDLVIGPLRRVEYDESKLQIKSDNDVLIVDHDTRITGRGMLIQLRPKSPQQPGGHSSGFEGAQNAQLNENVYVIFKDVGKSGILPDSGKTNTAKSGNNSLEIKAQVSGKTSGESTAKANQTTPEPVPLDLRCDGHMLVTFPEPHLPVKEGPPAPAPTLVHFERNVVVRRGQLSKLPAQLNCDNLDLTLVQADKTASGRGAQGQTSSQKSSTGGATIAGQVEVAGEGQTKSQGQTSDQGQTSSQGPALAAADSSQTAENPGSQDDSKAEDKGALGDLTLQRLKATGHAVWIQLPAEGLKIRMNELIHKVTGPSQSLTLAHGDATRKIMIEKYDFTEERPEGPDGPVVRKPESVTHVWAVDATMEDTGGGMESSNLTAYGPGLLETRPVPSQADNPLMNVPPDRTAVWQDLLLVKNLLGPEKNIIERRVVLKGRPKVFDRIKEASLDSVDLITAWLEPVREREESTPSRSTQSSKNEQSNAGPNAKGNSFRLKRLLALRDAHLVAPSKHMTARDVLDAYFIEESPPAASQTITAQAGSSAKGNTAQPGTGIEAEPADGAAAPGQDAQTAQNDQKNQKQKPAEPNMVAMANRVEANIITIANKSDRKPRGTAGKSPRTLPSSATSRSAGSASGESDDGYQVRDLRLFGTVSMHQDPEPGKTKGQDAYGETLVLRNDGPGQAIFNLYDRDPRRGVKPAAAPMPLRPHAKVMTEDMTIEGETIGVNQKTDEAWTYGPGKLVQMTDRSLLSDRTETTKEVNPDDPDELDDSAAADRAGKRPSPKPASEITVKPKRGMRAGKPLPEKVPLVITWGEKMLFYGRSVDPEGRPSAKAEFYRNVRAEMEDGLLRCTKLMTTYTDQPIPLAELGKMSQANRRKSPGKAKAADEQGKAEDEKPKPDLTLIDLVGNAVAISRKVDADRPILRSLQRLMGEHLIYDRRTGDFRVPCRGMAYLYDLDDGSRQQNGASSAVPVASGRPIRPTSGTPGERPGSQDRTQATIPSGASDRSKKPVLVLTQIAFSREMKGRFGTGKATDQTATRWAEFFGDVQTARCAVRNETMTVNYDKLPPDAYFLSSQTMRVVTEPPPPGSPQNTPARNFLKAWDASASTGDTTIQGDVITYDSLSDLIYANGEEGRLVQVVQQDGLGQPGSPMQAEAVRVNPRNGGVQVIGPQIVQLLEKKTGTRPTFVLPPDPNAKPPKPPKNPYRPPPGNIERKSFTGR